MGHFSRSWQITKESFRVINKDKELLLFPILSGIFSFIFLLLMLFPKLLNLLFRIQEFQISGYIDYLLIFITYLGISLIAIFFRVCAVYTAKRRFEGGNSTFLEAIKFGLSRFKQIFLWSLISATVGLILRIIEGIGRKNGSLGQLIAGIVTGIAGLAWSIVTIFVVPILVYEGLGPIESIKKSIQVLKQTWGESLIKNFGLGIISFLFILLIILITILLSVLASLIFWPLAVLITFLGILAIIFVAMLFNIASVIFDTALYEYATTGNIPHTYSQEQIAGAFKSKKRH